MFKSLKPTNQLSTVTMEFMLQTHEAYKKEGKSLNDWRDETGNTFLHIFCRANIGPLSMCYRDPDWQAITYALQHGVDPLEKNKAGKTAVKLILDRGLNMREDKFIAKPTQKEFFKLIKQYSPRYENIVDFITNDTIDLSDFDVSELPKNCLEKLQCYLQGQIDLSNKFKLGGDDFELKRISQQVKDELANLALANQSKHEADSRSPII